MRRLWFQRPPAGFRAVRGELIRQVQQALQAAAQDPGPLDGFFTPQTAAALQAYQARHDLPPTGAVDAATWSQLIGPEPPSLLMRCLQVTADFDERSFTRIVARAEGLDVAWGILGFTLADGSLPRVLMAFRDRHPEQFDALCWPFAAEILQLLEAPLATQRRWAESLAHGQPAGKVHRAWTALFYLLGRDPLVQAIQLEQVHPSWRRALADAHRFGLQTELGAALCFDIAVCAEGIEHAHDAPQIQRFIEATAATTDQEVRVIIAHVVAGPGGDPRTDLLRRRWQTLATGQGRVHQAHYDLATWGLADMPIDLASLGGKPS